MDTDELLLRATFQEICRKSMLNCPYPSRTLPNPNPLARLPSLPNELLLMLGDCLSLSELNALLRTSKHMHALYNDYLYKLSVREDGNLTLFWAAIKGKPAVARRVLALGADAESASKNNQRLMAYGTPHETPLLTAIAHNRLDVVEVLLSRGVNINFQGKAGAIPLEIATKEGKEDIVRVLLERGANVNQATAHYQTPLHSAVTGKHNPSLVRLLIARGAHLNALDGDQNTPLHVAYDKETVEILLESGAKLNDANFWATPLAIAVKAKDKERVRLLLEHGADVNDTNLLGETALFWVGKKWDPMRHPAIKFLQDPDVEIAQVLLDYGANIHHTDVNFGTALLSIVERGDVPTIKLLLEKGANAAVRTRKGLTPLHVAAEEGWPEILKLLLDHHANVNATNYYRSTPLHRLTSISKKRIRPPGNQDRYSESIAILIAAGANLNLQDRIGQTPLMKSAYHGYTKFVEQLMAAPGIDVTIKDRRNKTAKDLAKDTGLGSMLASRELNDKKLEMEPTETRQDEAM